MIYNSMKVYSPKKNIIDLNGLKCNKFVYEI